MSRPANGGNALLPWLALFTSAGTLLCCALPALLVALGLGAAVASAVAQFPALVWLSERKAWVFAAAGLMLAAAGLARLRSRNLSCPADRAKGQACRRLKTFGGVVYWVSVLLYLAGFAAATILPRLL